MDVLINKARREDEAFGVKCCQIRHRDGEVVLNGRHAVVDDEDILDAGVSRRIDMSVFNEKCHLYSPYEMDQRKRREAATFTMMPMIITGIVRRMSSMGVMPEMPDTAITTPAIGLMARESPAANCTGTTRAMVL